MMEPKLYLHLSSYLNGTEAPPPRPTAVLFTNSDAPDRFASKTLIDVVHTAQSTKVGATTLADLGSGNLILFANGSLLNRAHDGAFGVESDENGLFNHITIRPNKSPERMATLLVHEASHGGTASRMQSVLGPGAPFAVARTDLGMVDRALLAQVDEGTARVHQTVHAYERKQAGATESWEKELADPEQVFTCQALERSVANGYVPDSAETKRAVFDAYMTQTPRREWYDLGFMRAIAQLPSNESPSTLDNATLAACVQAKGEDFLDNLELRSPQYIGIWKDIHSPEDFPKAIRDLTLKAELLPYTDHLSTALQEMIEHPEQEAFGSRVKLTRNNLWGDFMRSCTDLAEYAKGEYPELEPVVLKLIDQTALAAEAIPEIAGDLLYGREKMQRTLQEPSMPVKDVAPHKWSFA